MKPKPEYVAQLQRNICAERHCEYLDKINYLDPCAACPNGHWGRYTLSGCKDDGTGIQSDQVKLQNLIYPTLSGLGPGTELKKLLAKFGLKPAPGCKCTQHIQEMNLKGIEWCAENIPTIVGWLKEEAHRARLPFFETGAKIIVRRSISNARKSK